MVYVYIFTFYFALFVDVKLELLWKIEMWVCVGVVNY